MASFAKRSLPSVSAIIGNADYLSPEQARGMNRKMIDWRAEIYALGVVVYDMLIGDPPFTASKAAGYQPLQMNVMPERPFAAQSDDESLQALESPI